MKAPCLIAFVAFTAPLFAQENLAPEHTFGSVFMCDVTSATYPDHVGDWEYYFGAAWYGLPGVGHATYKKTGPQTAVITYAELGEDSYSGTINLNFTQASEGFMWAGAFRDDFIGPLPGFIEGVFEANFLPGPAFLGADAVADADGLIASSWMGNVWALPGWEGWFYQTDFGWAYVALENLEPWTMDGMPRGPLEEEDSFWFSTAAGWFYTSAARFPWMWYPTSGNGEWVALSPNTGGWCWFSGQQTWQKIAFL